MPFTDITICLNPGFSYIVQMNALIAALVTHDEQETHTCRIHDMPHGKRPREKLAHLGPSALDNAELIALFISTGTRGRSAIEIGRRLVAKYGSIGALGSLPVSELAKEHGLGLAKASKLAAAFELGARVAREQVHDRPLDSADVIHDIFGPQLRHLPQEQVIVVTLDTRLRHSSTTVVSIGTVDQSAAHPREILRPVITRGAYGFVLIHNHPSGDPSPSRADEEATHRIIEAAQLMQVRFIDHVIIGKASPGRMPYYSFREAGLIR
ncbi:MAG: repair protein RadC [Verrucomicrobiota bacterium]